jgi:hypothetical protein
VRHAPLRGGASKCLSLRAPKPVMMRDRCAGCFSRLDGPLPCCLIARKGGSFPVFAFTARASRPRRSACGLRPRKRTCRPFWQPLSCSLTAGLNQCAHPERIPSKSAVRLPHNMARRFPFAVFRPRLLTAPLWFFGFASRPSLLLLSPQLAFMGRCCEASSG